MLKNLILFFFTLFLFVRCEKNVESPDPSFELVKGEWVRKLATNEYYDSSGNLEYSNKEVGIIEYTITEGNITTLYRHAANQVVNYTYTTSVNNAKRFLNVTQGNKTDTYELISVTEQSMVWRMEKTDFTYYNYGASAMRKAAKYIRTLEFEK